MKKFLLRLLIVALLGVLGGQASLWLLSYQAGEKLKQFHSDSGSLVYGYADASLAGRLVFENVEYTSFVLKRTARVEQVTIEFGGITELIETVIGSPEALYTKVHSIQFNAGSLENGGRELTDWLKTEVHEDLLRLFGVYGACGEFSSLSHKTLEEMGVQDTLFDATLFFQVESDARSAAPLISLEVDLKALGGWKIDADIDSSELFEGKRPLELSASYISLSYIDQGFFRRLSNFCESKAGLERSDFALLAAQQMSRNIDAHGYRVNDETVELYKKYLGFGGKLDLEVSQSDKRVLSDWPVYETNLLDSWNASITLNGAVLEGLNIMLEESHYVLADEGGATEIRKEVNRPNLGVSFPTNIVLPGPIEKETLEDFLGQSVKVQLLDGKVHEGKLSKVEEFSIELDKPVTGGQLSYSISKEDIESTELIGE